MNANAKDIWVFVETSPDGLAACGIELLDTAAQLADAYGGASVAVVAGSADGTAAAEAALCGADRVVKLISGALSGVSADTYAAALSQLMEGGRPAALLFGASPLSRELAARMACRLRTSITTDFTAARIPSGSDSIVWTRPVFGGAYMAETTCSGARPQIGVAKQNAFKRGGSARPAVETVEAGGSLSEIAALCALREFVPAAGDGELSIEDAQVVVAGGRGVGSAEGFGQLRELAELLGGAVACSRAVTDADWMPNSALVGQTGKTIAPKLYIACGISGAMQHTCGMEDSDCVIAINKDPEAPIFEIAKYGVVGDLNAVIPALIEEIKRIRA